MENFISSPKELDVKSKRCCDGINKTIHVIANEPSLGLFRIQQHVRKMLPKLDSSENSVNKTNKEISGLIYDTQASIEVAKDINRCEDIFSNIEELLKKASSTAALMNMQLRPQHADLIKFE